MVSKYIVFAAVLTAARAGVIGPTATTVGIAQPTENYDANPQYSYSYSVADSLTGDNKSQEETRIGNIIRGRYSLDEPDGSRRTVSYAADPVKGFNAIVQKSPKVSPHQESQSNDPVLPASPVQYFRSAALIRPSVSATSVIEAPAVIASGSPNLRPSVTASNIISTNGGLIGTIPLSLGRFGLQSLYGFQPVITSASRVVGVQ